MTEPTSAAKSGLVARLSERVLRSPQAALAVILLLTLALAASLLYYRGVLGLGPYAGKKTAKGSTDAEIDKLVASIEAS